MAATDRCSRIRRVALIAAAGCLVFVVSAVVRAAPVEAEDSEARLWMSVNQTAASFYGLTKYNAVAGQAGAITTVWLDGGTGYHNGGFVASGSEGDLSCGNRMLYGIHIALLDNDYVELKNPWSLAAGMDCVE